MHALLKFITIAIYTKLQQLDYYNAQLYSADI